MKIKTITALMVLTFSLSLTGCSSTLFDFSSNDGPSKSEIKEGHDSNLEDYLLNEEDDYVFTSNSGETDSLSHDSNYGTINYDDMYKSDTIQKAVEKAKEDSYIGVDDSSLVGTAQMSRSKNVINDENFKTSMNAMLFIHLNTFYQPNQDMDVSLVKSEFDISSDLYDDIFPQNNKDNPSICFMGIKTHNAQEVINKLYDYKQNGDSIANNAIVAYLPISDIETEDKCLYIVYIAFDYSLNENYNREGVMTTLNSVGYKEYTGDDSAIVSFLSKN